MKITEVPRTAFEIGVGAGDLLGRWMNLRLNPFACGMTVLGTGTVRRDSDIYLHDHSVRYPSASSMATVITGDELHPVAAYTDPKRGLVVEPYDFDKHGYIDRTTWLKEGETGPGGTIHQHINGGCVP